MTDAPFDPDLDLLLERVVDVPPELVWRAWTEPEQLKQWFTPHPWSTSDCEIDLRPGGAFNVTMRSPEGEDMPSTGCYLEIDPGRRLLWTSALAAGYRPSGVAEMPITVSLTIEPSGGGTSYRALVRHADSEGRAQHEEMGFHDGWGTALDQLVEWARQQV